MRGREGGRATGQAKALDFHLQDSVPRACLCVRVCGSGITGVVGTKICLHSYIMRTCPHVVNH